MNRQFIKDAFMWGFLLWLTGYLLGVLLFMIVPPSMIGWMITPVGVIITLWVLFKKVKIQTFRQYILLGILWLLIAVICDYFLLVKLFNPADGYYKFDVYLYYFLTLALPLLAGWRKAQRGSK